MKKPVIGDSVFAHLQSKSTEWYIHAAREVMGGMDLDPASSALANTVVQASHYYDEAANGLENQFCGAGWATRERRKIW